MKRESSSSRSRADTSRDPRRIRALFSEIAPKYDLGNHLTSANMDRRWRRVAARRCVGYETRRVLDCCCGTCDLALAAARRMAALGVGGKGCVTGTDFAKPMLPLALRKIERERLPVAVRALQADTLALPFADGAFDLVTIGFGLRNLVDREAGLREMARVLRPGGEVMILEFTQPPNPLVRRIYYLYFFRLLPWVARVASGSREYGYLPASVVEFPGPETLAKMVAGAGFENVTFERLTLGIVAIHRGRKPET